MGILNVKLSFVTRSFMQTTILIAALSTSHHSLAAGPNDKYFQPGLPIPTPASIPAGFSLAPQAVNLHSNGNNKPGYILRYHSMAATQYGSVDPEGDITLRFTAAPGSLRQDVLEPSKTFSFNGHLGYNEGKDVLYDYGHGILEIFFDNGGSKDSIDLVSILKTMIISGDHDIAPLGSEGRNTQPLLVPTEKTKEGLLDDPINDPKNSSPDAVGISDGPNVVTSSSGITGYTFTIQHPHDDRSNLLLLVSENRVESYDSAIRQLEETKSAYESFQKNHPNYNEPMKIENFAFKGSAGEILYNPYGYRLVWNDREMPITVYGSAPQFTSTQQIIAVLDTLKVSDTTP